MDRRHWLGLIGSGVGVSLDGAAHGADEHRAAEKTAGGLMAPVQSLHAHFCGIHIAKSNPKFQLIAQHYCMSRSEEMHQCLLYDSCEKNAKLLGVEYIVSDRLYRQLPDAEKKYWHPHTYEVLAGGLIAPSMKPDDELAFMKALLTTWGKTWHTWPDPRTPVPLGEPLLMWAVTGDGQLEESVLDARDKQFNVKAAEIREKRGQSIGWRVPKVSLPRSVDQVGRQWTDDGEDKPTPRR
ncbi:MAG: DUF1264 domain-containing protein [Isosphaerales bacterium]